MKLFLCEPLVLDGQVYPVGVYLVSDHVDFLLGGPLSLRDFLGYDQVKSRVLLDTLNSDAGMRGLERRHYERFILQGMGEGYRKEFHQRNVDEG